jgi:flagellar biosynthetic protein FliQ
LSLELLAGPARDALFLVLALSLPVAGVAALASLVVALFQATTQVNDAAVAHLPRLLAVALALVLLGPWMGHQLGAFAEHVFTLAAAR